MRMFTTIGLISVIACRTDKSITIQNPAPKADIISHDTGSVVLERISTTFIGQVTDANHTPDQLTTIWYVNGDIVCDEVIPDENGETICELALGLEDTEITLAVRDSENARSEDTIVVSIEPTEAPEAEILTPIGSGVYYSDQKITFEGIISDAEDAPEILSAFWESDIDGVLSNVDTDADSTGTVVGYEYLMEGEHAIELHVEDSTGKTDRETVIIDVGPPNSAPLCEILTPLDGAAGAEGSLVSFIGTTSDVDVASDWLSVTWSSDKDGELGSVTPDSSGNIVFSYSNLSVNTHTISLQVADEVGATCTAVRTYTVGTPPSITIDSPLDGVVLNAGGPISFNATVSDAQDQPDAVALDWVANGSSISTQGATSSGTATFSDSTLTYGAYNLVVTATDSDGLTDSDQINFTVNGVPSAPVVSINPNTPTTSDGLNVSIDSPSVDPEGVTPTYTYEWQLGGQAQTTYTSSSLPSSATSKGEQWTVVVTPNDGIVDGVAGTASVVIGNTAPSVGTVLVMPSGTVYNDDVLTCSASVTDPDETPTTSYDWTIGGSVVGTSATLDLSASGVMPGDTVVCTVTAIDSDLATDSNSGSQTVGNRNPSVSASISTNGTNQNAELTCVGTATDPDGETPTVTYEWFNGSTSLGSANPLLLNSTIVSSGDVVDCMATATDTMGGTDTATASHTVTNTIPVINSVTVTPDPATAGTDDLTCDVTATDADGDAILYTYEWSDSSGVQQTTTLVSDTSDVFLASGTTEDTWTCEVTPYDGTDYGSALNHSVTVGSGCTSLEFDGTSNLAIGNAASLAFTSVSIEAWIQPSTVNLGDSYIANKKGRSYGGHIAYGIGQTNDTFRVRLQVGSCVACNDAIHFIDLYSPNIQINQWYHLTATYDEVTGVGTMYLNGQSVDSLTRGTGLNYTDVSEPFGVGVTFVSDVSTPEAFWSGQLSQLRVFNGALSSTEVNDLYLGNVISQSPSLKYDGYTSGGTQLDRSGLGNHAVNNGVIEIGVCPEEDLDGDGVAAWEDCDDNDALTWDSGSGASSACAAESCKTILDDGYSIGDGTYWIDPDGSGAFEAYCDMATDGGGWTLIEAYDIVNKNYYYNKTFNTDDMSRNPTSPNWDDYRLSLATITSLTNVSTQMHARCHRDFNSSPNDFIFGDVVLITNNHSAVQLLAGTSNPYNVNAKIRGYDATSFNMRWYQGTCCGGHWHAGSDVQGVLPNATPSEDSFTWHECVLNTNHLCHTSAGEIVWMVR
jgi:hypothetical protein